MLPQKTYLKQECKLYESDFEVTGSVKPHRVMELMQDVATTHADKLGFGWDLMNANGLFWVLSKVKIVINKPLTRTIRSFTLYTWPIRAGKFFVERRFVAVDSCGEQLFCSSTLWLMVERDTRRIASSATISQFYNADFDDTPCDCDVQYQRIRRDDDFTLAYERTIRRTDLDINRHVNNTNYINYVVDALNVDDKVKQIELVYQKELKMGDAFSVYVKRNDNAVLVTGERDETCFTAKIVLE